MISKKTFVEIIEFLNKREQAEDKVDEALDCLDTDATGFWYLFSEYKDKIISLLDEAMDLKIVDEDIGTDLDYWYYELDRGRSLHKDQEGLAEVCYIDNPADLYDYLTKKD